MPRIKNVNGHYEVYDDNGLFLFSAEKKFEIFYTDLTLEARERFDQFLGSEGGDNFDMFPIAFMELEEDAQ